MSRRNLAWLLGVPAVILFGIAVTASAPKPSTDYRLLRTIVDVLAEVDRNYVRPMTDEDRQKLVEDMINGGLARLDPHSQYFNQEQLEQFETSSEGQFVGIGVVITADPTTGYVKVESPLPGTPAYQAGLQAGDLILKVDGKSTEGLTISEARMLIIGPPDTQVTLTILPELGGDKREVTLTRSMIELHPVQGFARQKQDPTKWNFMADEENKIGLIRVLTFNEKTEPEIRAAVSELAEQGAKGLILDLRDNPGGLLDQAIKVADLFLDSGVIVATEDRQGGTRSRSAKKAGTLFLPANEKPMAVLINRDSASAAEIVASALQDNGRAVVVGERSYGKGSVQKVFPLNVAGTNSGAVKLTTEVWLTPKGKNIHRWPDSKTEDEWGVLPDPNLDVELTNEQRIEFYNQMRKLDMVKGKPRDDQKEPAKPEQEEPEFKDPVLDKALDYLRGKLQGVGAVRQLWKNAA